MQPVAKIALVKKPPYVSPWALEHPVARFTKLTQSLTAGMLLAQIVFWHLPGKTGKSKLRVGVKKGYWWVAKTREEWMKETGLTLKQYKSAIRLLVSKNLVVVQQMPWIDENLRRLNVSHIRLLDKSLLDSSGPKGTAQSGPKGTTQSGPIGTTLYNIENNRENNRELAQAPAERDGETETGGGGDEGEGGVEEGGSVEEVEEVGTVAHMDHILSEVAGFGSCMVEPDSATIDAEPDMRAEDILKRGRQPSDRAALPALWLRVVHESFGGFQKPLTAKERGQLTHLSKALGDRTRAVIEGTVDKWGKFAARVEYERGTSSPNTPTIGFLLKHFDVAVDLLAEQTPAGASVETTSVQLSAAPMIPTPAPVEVPHKLTDAEYHAFLEGLEKKP
jgi:hypothetical protein